MGGEWVRRKIGSLGKIVTGKTPSTKDAENFGGDYPFITIPDLDGRVWIDHTTRTLSTKGAHAIRTSMIPAGAVLMSCIATVGKCGITTRPSFTNQQINSVIPGPDVDSLFLYYVFTQLGRKLDAAGSGGSVYTNISKKRFSEIEVIIPADISEQRAIAHILGTLDDKIELNRRMNETLEAMARALFKSWFVDFDPVVVNAIKAGNPIPEKFAKRAAHYRQYPDALRLPEHTLRLFPDRFVDSELGPIPEGWEVGRVADFGDIITGKTPPTKDPNNYGDLIPFITIPDMHGKVYVTSTKKRLSLQGAELQKNKYIPPNSVCVSCIATPGLVVLTAETSQTNQQINCIVPKEISPYFVYGTLYMLGEQIRAGGSGGSVFSNLNKRRFSDLRVLLPNKKSVAMYHSMVKSWFEHLLRNEKEAHTLSTLRDSLLPRLASGELRVPATVLEELSAQAGVLYVERHLEESGT